MYALPVLRQVFPISTLLFATSCATLVHGSRQVVPITSNPPGARVTIDSVTVGVTPMQATMQRSRAHLVSIVADSAHRADFTMRPRLSGWLLGNLWIYVAPAAIDFASGSAYRLRPYAIHAELPTATISAAAAEANAPTEPLRVSADRRLGSRIGIHYTGYLNLIPAIGGAMAGDLAGGLFVGTLTNAVSIPLGAVLGAAAAKPRISPAQAQRVGSPLLLGDLVRWRESGQTNRAGGHLLDLDQADAVVVVGGDTLRVARQRISELERAVGYDFTKGMVYSALLGTLIGVGYSLACDCSNNDLFLSVSIGAVYTVATAGAAFAPRRWERVLRW